MAENKKISFVFEKAKNHRTHAVNGAFGGASPDQSTIVANLYVESVATPNIMTKEVDGDGKILPDSEERITRSDVIREIQSTIVLSPQNAIQLGEFLIRHGQNAIQNRGKND